MASLVEILIELKDQASQKFEELLGSVGKVSGAVDFLKVGLEAIAGAEIVAGIEHLVGLFAEHEMSIVRLNEGLRVTGRYSDAGSDAIQKMAQMISETTTTSRSAALAVSQLGAAFTKTLSAEQLAELQKAAVAMADTFGMNTERAARMLMRGLEGSGAMLKRYGIEIDKASSEQERFHKIMERFGPLFDISTAAANTLGGQIAIAKEQFSQLEEVLGEVIARSTGLTEKGHTIGDMIKGWRKSIEENETSWVHWGTVTYNFLVALFETLKYLIVGFFQMGQVIGEAFGLGLRVIGDTVEALFNIGRVIGDLVVLGVTWLESKWGDFANWLIDKFNDLILQIPEKVRNFLGISVIGHIANVAAEELADAKKNVTADANATAHAIDDMTQASADTANRMKDHFGAIEDGATHMANAWKTAVGSINATPVAPPSTAREGSGENRKQTEETAQLSERVHQLIEAEKMLDAQYKAGLVTEKEYLETKKTLRGAIEAAITELRNEKISISDKAFAEHLKLLTELISAYEHLGGAVTKFGDAFRKAWIGNEDPVKKANEELAKMAVTFANSLATGIATAIEASGNFGQAIKKTIADAAKAESIHALAQGIEEIAKAFADPLQSGRHIASAEKFFESAAVYAAVAGLAGGFGGGGGGGGGAAAQTQAVSNLAGGNVTVNVPNTFTSDPAFWDALIGGLEQAGLKNVHVVSQG